MSKKKVLPTSVFANTNETKAETKTEKKSRYRTTITKSQRAITFFIDGDKYRKLKQQVLNEDTTVRDIIDRAIDKYLKEKENE
jgi:hypothetical protein